MSTELPESCDYKSEFYGVVDRTPDIHGSGSGQAEGYADTYYPTSEEEV